MQYLVRSINRIELQLYETSSEICTSFNVSFESKQLRPVRWLKVGKRNLFPNNYLSNFHRTVCHKTPNGVSSILSDQLRVHFSLAWLIRLEAVTTWTTVLQFRNDFTKEPYKSVNFKISLLSITPPMNEKGSLRPLLRLQSLFFHQWIKLTSNCSLKNEGQSPFFIISVLHLPIKHIVQETWDHLWRQSRAVFCLRKVNF